LFPVFDDEVLVQVKKTGTNPFSCSLPPADAKPPGICGSDVHYLLHGRIGDFVVEKPMVSPRRQEVASLETDCGLGLGPRYVVEVGSRMHPLTAITESAGIITKGA
jgi:hypothetical protein